MTDRPHPPWTILHRDVVASTSDLARALVEEGRAPLPIVVTAARQTAGRGRGAHTWWSDPGSLTFTLALDPLAHALRPEHEPKLALATAVAIIEALEPPLPSGTLGIRWPNDVEAAGRKLGGILPERVETDHGPRLLIGVGLNVQTRLEDAPPEVRRMATSVEALRASTPLPSDARTVVLHAILCRLLAAVAALAQGDPVLAERWAQLDTLLGQPVRIDLGSRIITGQGRGIDPQGRLLLATAQGEQPFLGGRVLREPSAAPSSRAGTEKVPQRSAPFEDRRRPTEKRD